MNTQNQNTHHFLSANVVPKLLKQSAGAASCCIFRVPESLARNNHMAYCPRIVSIGPYHHGEKQLEMIQEHKHRFLKFFLAESSTKGTNLQDLVGAVSDLEERIRCSYSENLTEFDSEKLIDMMVLDGCFVLTLFLVVSKKVNYSDSSDPIFRIPWFLPAIRTDLLLLENQVPFFLLQTLLEKSKLVSPSTGLNEIVFVFFGYSIEKPVEYWSRHYNLKAKHLLDLIRKTFIPFSSQDQTPKHICVRIFRGCKEESETETPKDCCFKSICGSNWKSGIENSFQPLKKICVCGCKEESETETSKDCCFKSIRGFNWKSGIETSMQPLKKICVCGCKEESATETPKDCCFKSICGSTGKSGIENSFQPLKKIGAKTSPDSRPFLRLILSAKKLHLRGIKFRPKNNADTLLDIGYNDGVLEIPPFLFDDFISSMLLNCVAFEQFNTKSKGHITSYVVFLGCLINSEADASFLTEKGIVENYFGTEDEVSTFFKSIGKDIAFYLPQSYLAQVFEEVNEYTSKGWHVSWAEFKLTHFYSPWTCISSCAALTLLVLTLIQAFFAAYSYFRPPKGH